MLYHSPQQGLLFGSFQRSEVFCRKELIASNHLNGTQLPRLNVTPERRNVGTSQWKPLSTRPTPQQRKALAPNDQTLDHG